MAKGGNLIIVILHLIVGIYFINYPFNFLKLPDIAPADAWVIFIGGILILFGIVNYFKVRKNKLRQIMNVPKF